MQNRYKRILIFIGVLLLGCIFVGVAYLFYDKVIKDATEVEVMGDLSINYLNGKRITDNSLYNFSITNNGSNDLYFEILIDNLKNYESKVKYSLLSKEASLNLTNETLNVSTNSLASNILIPKGTTENFSLQLSNNSMTSFDLIIKKTTDSKEYFYATILKNNEVKQQSTTLVGTELATTDEGLIEDIDDYGITYYFRGNVSNNYVNFADLTWRIVKINGDGTVKLVLNELAPELSNYHGEIKEIEDYPNTSIINSLNSYYATYLQNYDEYIAGAKYCIETLNDGGEKTKTYNAYNRLAKDKIPSFNCLGKTFNNKIGLLTADEVMYAGANLEDDNKEYYLYNSKIENNWWTSTLAKSTESDFNPFAVSQNGKVVSNVSGLLFRGLRPSINLDRKVIVSGTGSIDNPYLISE